MSPRLWILRHGNTFEAGEPSRRIGARTDPPLTAAGRAQADAVRAAFAARGIVVSRAIAGPLRRTRETAAIVADREPDVAGFLAEIDHGPDEDATEEAVVARIGNAALAAWDATATPPPGWIVGAGARIAAWRECAAAARGDTLLVTSNGAARFAPLALGLRPAALKLRTGAWGRIDVADGGVRLVEWDVRP